MSKIIKISFIVVLTIILLIFSVFFIVYRLGFEHTEYPPCELLGCKIILHSTVNNNSFQDTGHDLSLEISNDSGITNTIEIGGTLRLKVKVEGISLLENKKNKVILVISTLDDSEILLIDKKTLTRIEGIYDIDKLDTSKFGNIVNRQEVVLPNCK